MTPAERSRRLRRLLWIWGLAHVVMTISWAITRLDHFANPTLITITGDIANLCAFHGIILFTLMGLLGARAQWLEQIVGLDKMLLKHRALAPWIILLFVAHAVLRTWSLSMEWEVPYQVSFLYRLGPTAWTTEWEVALGRAALAIMALASALAYLGQKYQLLDYKVWKIPHMALYVALPMGFIHAVTRGDDTVESAMLPLWAGLLVIFALETARRIRYIRHRTHDHIWTLDEMTREADHTSTLHMSHPKAPGPFADRKAGQFGVLRVPGIAHMDEPHPFTFSGPEHDEADPRLRMTVKVAGDFTAELVTLPQDTLVLVEGPYGNFCSDVREQKKLAFIAGGVGATPFLSVLRTFRDQGVTIPVSFIWGNKTREDILAAEELAAMAEEMPLVVHHVISREPPHVLEACPLVHGVQYHSGRVGPELFMRCMSGEESCYVCGPEPFLNSTLRGLKTAFDMPASRVSREHFFW